MKQLQGRRQKTDQKQAADIRRKGVQKKWKVGINKTENRKVKNKFNRTNPQGAGDSIYFSHIL
jgi:hypothetical protein